MSLVISKLSFKFHSSLFVERMNNVKFYIPSLPSEFYDYPIETKFIHCKQGLFIVLQNDLIWELNFVIKGCLSLLLLYTKPLSQQSFFRKS